MKQFKLFILTFLVAGFAHAQNVGINTTGAAPDAGAGLDINFTNKGLLVPRVNINNLNTIAPITGSATTSLLVYNTNGTTGAGYHYWNGAQWVRLALSSEAWKVDGNAGLNAANNFLGTTDNVPVRIRTNNVERFEFTTNGRLRSLNAGTSAAPTYSWTADNDIGMFRPAANQLAFSTGGNERMRIDQNGVVGIGTTTPSTSGFGVSVDKLHISSNTTAVGGVMVQAINSNSGVGLFAYNTSTTNGFATIEGATNGTANSIAINGIHLPGVPPGFLGFGIGTRGVTSSVEGYGVFGANPAIGAYPITFGAAVYADGDLVWTGNAYNPSDRRLKKNIQELKHSALENILNLKVYNYDMDTSVFHLNQRVNSHTGFIAQEMQEIFPELVAEKILVEQSSSFKLKEDNTKMKTGKFLTVNHIGLIPVLTKAIQEQQEQIESYEERISKLESQLQELLEKQ